MKPIFYLLAGPNGIGKSTLYAHRVADGTIHPDAEFVNADLYERDHLQHITEPQARSEAARHWADARRAQLLASGVSFVSETVFSHESKLALIREAQAAGFVVSLYVLCLDDAQQLLARVAQRAIEGGHDVPPERILQRYPRTVAHLKQAIHLADVAFLYDTSSANSPSKNKTLTPQARLIALVEGAHDTPLIDPLPDWAQAMLA